MVVMTHNTDISDTWEREGENREYFDRFSPDGYAVGVNIIALRDDALEGDPRRSPRRHTRSSRPKATSSTPSS